MPRYEHAVPGTPCWIELIPGDMKAASEFYGAVFGWTFTDIGPEMGHYNIISIGDDVVGGSMQNDPAQMGPNSDYFSLFFATEDVDATLIKTTELGGTVLLPGTDVPGQGRFGAVTDPFGVGFCLWQPSGRQGFDCWGEPGFPAWFELQTPHAEASANYYAAVLGDDIGTAEMSEDMMYYTLDRNGENAAGINDVSSELSETDPGFWLIYFGVSDVDATVGVIEEHGGMVLMPAMDSPYGRFATVQDPAGTIFNIVDVTGGGEAETES